MPSSAASASAPLANTTSQGSVAISTSSPSQTMASGPSRVAPAMAAACASGPCCTAGHYRRISIFLRELRPRVARSSPYDPRIVRLTPLTVRAFASRFVIALIAGTLLTGAGIRLGNWYEDKKVGEIPKIKFHAGTLNNRGKADDPAKPANFLIVGNDGRGFVTSEVDKQHFGTTPG